MARIGFIGLGRMGGNMVHNLLDKRRSVVVYNRSPEKMQPFVQRGARAAQSVAGLVGLLPKPRILWLMIKAGKPVDDLIKQLLPYLEKGDIIIDGGNSFYKESIKRHNALKKRGINFLDCGTSGGMEGARHGACQMIGGEKKVFKKVEWIFRDMCVKEGYGYMGSAGAGHFVKMVHNGIEYGMMGAIAEGMHALQRNTKKFGIDLTTAATVYSHGSIIESRLMSWLLDSYKTKGYLAGIAGVVPKGETEVEMQHIEKIADVPVLKAARLQRVKTRTRASYTGKLIAAMRNQFGGHAVKKK